MPKAELHVHHVGSADLSTIAKLAARYPDSPVPQEDAGLADFFAFTDFAHFVRAYMAVVDLIRDANDVWTLTDGVAAAMVEQNIRYAELTVTPISSVERGIPPEAFMEAIEDVRATYARAGSLELAWIFDIPAQLGRNPADGTLELATTYAPDGLIGFGLGGAETPGSTASYADQFAKARATGLHPVPHAGETAGPTAMWSAITDLKAQRIGHGIGCVDDPALVDYLRDTQLPLEVCVTSNIATRAADSYQSHPLRDMVSAGLNVTINSDDPPMFGTSLNREYEIAAELLNLNEQSLTELALNAVTCSFASDNTKRAIIDEIRRYRDGFIRP